LRAEKRRRLPRPLASSEPELLEVKRLSSDALIDWGGSDIC
jgi:hypothetical protein